MKIVLFYTPSDGWLCGIRFFDAAGKMIYEGAYKGAFTNSRLKQHEILLNEGQQIVGFQSRDYSNAGACHADFQFIIGSD